MSEEYEKKIENIVEQRNQHYYTDLSGIPVLDNEDAKIIALHLGLRLVRAGEKIADKKVVNEIYVEKQ